MQLFALQTPYILAGGNATVILLEATDTNTNKDKDTARNEITSDVNVWQNSKARCFYLTVIFKTQKEILQPNL